MSQPMQQAPGVAGFPGFAMQPAANSAPPMPTELLARVSIPLLGGCEIGGYLTFPVPASHASLQGLQALATAIAASWPIVAYQPPRQPQQGGWSGQQGGGNGGGGYQNGYQNGGGFQNNNGFQGRRFGGGGGFRRW